MIVNTTGEVVKGGISLVKASKLTLQGRITGKVEE